jgi:molecular chaperone DnaK
MAKDNKTIGKFKLTGIQKAPAGVPQIEVTFDIDTNGILKVSAKDLNTGKEQSITITDNERMSDAEIDQAIRDAEQYAAQDGLRREALELQNTAGAALSKAENALHKVGKQLDKEEKKRVKSDCGEVRKLLARAKPEKMTAEDISNLRAAVERLEASSANAQKMAEGQP